MLLWAYSRGEGERGFYVGGDFVSVKSIVDDDDRKSKSSGQILVVFRRKTYTTNEF